jgi:light-regulated signal transduction histidine kinase (bacteriophytochrome)
VLKRPVDLSSCDTEPIHVIGAIQPSADLECFPYANEGQIVLEFVHRDVVRGCGQ